MSEPSITRKVSNGRWTAEEHQMFLEGLRLFGKDWKSIQGLIQTRNGTQIRSHAQKFFIKVRETSCPSDDIGSEKSGGMSSEECGFSYFLSRIAQIESRNVNFDFWDALIDQQTSAEKEETSTCIRKASFQLCSQADQELEDLECTHKLVKL